jgi:soluble lytic murein transglycosylase-like protein
VSFLNGLSGLGKGLTDFGTILGKDAEETQRRSFLNATPAPAVDPPAATAAETPSAAAAEKPSRGGVVVANVPAAYLPFYEAASKRTGIPIDILIAQGKQESGFNPDAVGTAGEIGLHQIKPSTAADPGFGMKGIDPVTLRDPAVNINFAADYLRARAGNVNFNDPTAVDAALRSYNGGGDRNYVQNVRRHIGGA